MLQQLSEWLVAGSFSSRAVSGAKPQEYSEAELFLATSRFSQAKHLSKAHNDEPLGSSRGIYSGTLRDGTKVAVHVLKTDATGERESTFTDEISALHGLCHPNVVHLLGSCIGATQSFLVYEWLEAGSAAQWLRSSQHEETGTPFRWSERLRLAMDAVNGLLYLHSRMSREEIERRVLHRNIKASSILLERSGTAKVGNFGVSESAGMQQVPEFSQAQMRGMPIFACSEEIRSGALSESFEVHAFGIVMLQLLTNVEPVRVGRRGAVVYPLFEAVMQPQENPRAMLDRAAMLADPCAVWPSRLVEDVSLLALTCTAGRDESVKFGFKDVERQLKSLAQPFLHGKRSLREGESSWCAGGPPVQPKDNDAPTLLQVHRIMSDGLANALPGSLVKQGSTEGSKSPPEPKLVCVMAMGMAIPALRPEKKTISLSELPLAIGRRHQRGFFEYLLGSGEGRKYLALISREHLELSRATGRKDAGGVKVLNASVNPVSVGPRQLGRGQAAVLEPGDSIDFVEASPSGGLVVYLRLQLEHPQLEEPPLDAPKVPRPGPPKEAELDAKVGLVGASFWLNLTGTVVRKDFHAERRRLRGGPAGLIVGRQHQAELFQEAFDEDVRRHIDAEHFRIEGIDGAWHVTSLTGQTFWRTRGNQRLELQKYEPVRLSSGDSIVLPAGGDTTPGLGGGVAPPSTGGSSGRFVRWMFIECTSSLATKQSL